MDDQDEREVVLDIRDLATQFYSKGGIVKAVDGVSFDVREGECLAIVGESGCGKSATAMSILRLIPFPPGVIAGGEVLFRGEDLTQASEARMREVRGNQISMVFQEAGTALNPALTVGNQIMETIQLHRSVSREEARARALELMRLVGIPDPESRIDKYPHEFSGGMQQRVMIAAALSCDPDVIIADEPTTALDVTVQAQILDLIDNLRQSQGTAVVIITHNLGIVARYAHRVIVMYAGNIVESAPTDEIYGDMLHPYTLGLLSSVPRLDDEKSRKLQGIPGLPPDLAHMPPGCPYASRCPFKMDRCETEKPALVEEKPGHLRACFADPDLIRSRHRAALVA